MRDLVPNFYVKIYRHCVQKDIHLADCQWIDCRIDEAGEQTMGLGFWHDASFHQRSVLVSLLAVAALDTVYFLQVLTPGAALDASDLLRLFVAIVVVLVAIEVGFHCAQRYLTGPQIVDERDDLISARAHRLAYLVLLIGVVVALAILLVNAGNGATVQVGGDRQIAHLEVHVFIGAMVSAELVRFGSQLWFYRRGV